MAKQAAEGKWSWDQSSAYSVAEPGRGAPRVMTVNEDDYGLLGSYFSEDVLLRIDQSRFSQAPSVSENTNIDQPENTQAPSASGVTKIDKSEVTPAPRISGDTSTFRASGSTAGSATPTAGSLPGKSRRKRAKY
jgi:hypothetical protein